MSTPRCSGSLCSPSAAAHRTRETLEKGSLGLYLIRNRGVRDPMEEKQLDFNQPFLSVRRYSSSAPAPPPPEARERRRKVDGSSHQLPPLPRYKSELKSGPVSNPGMIPFVWEKVPGKPKEKKESPDCTALDCHPAAPEFPPGSSQKVEVEDGNSGKDSNACADIGWQRRTETKSVAQEVAKPVPKHESSEDGIGDRGGSCSEDSDEAFLDARDTFSRSDSFFLNCSVVSALSGLDSPDLRSPGRANADAVARDLMMGRFLPAAKAMTSEVPQHAARKPLPSAQASSRPAKLSDNSVKKDFRIVDQNRPKIALRTVLNGGESEDDNYDDYENSPAKVCGMLPCFRLSNPVPGIKSMHPPRPHSARRHKVSVSGNRAKRSPSEKDGTRLEGSDLYKRLQANGQFLKPKEVSLRDAFKAEGSFGAAAEEHNEPAVDSTSNPPEKQMMNFLELLASEGSEWESGSTGPVAERTLYVDSVRLVKSQDSSACSSDSKVLSDRNDLESKNAALWKSSCRETELSGLSNDKSVDTKMEEMKKRVQFSSVPSDEPNSIAQVDTVDPFTNEREITTETEAKAKNGQETYGDGKIDQDNQFATNSVDREISVARSLNIHLPPPLPKSPSDSWLSRTLLTASSKSSSVLSRHTATSKSRPVETKWETIVRTSYIHHGHLRFSEELLSPVPEA